MPRKTLTYRSQLNVPARVAFDWYKHRGAFERLTPPWQGVQVLEKQGGIDAGLVNLRIKAAGIWVKWQLQHLDYIEGKQFVDQQVKGPFAFWRHIHEVESVDDHTCALVEKIEYQLPLGKLGDALGGRMTKNKLTAAMAYRHRQMENDLERLPQAAAPLTVAISGARGLIGSALTPLLNSGGHQVKPMVRGAASKTSERPIFWQPSAGEIDGQALEGVDAVVHLAGEPISGRWTKVKMQKIRDSRIEGTQLLAKTLAKLKRKPRVLVCASAVGFFGDRADETLTEASEPGQGFLAKTCQQWEKATQAAADSGIRVVFARFGLILSPSGGALKAMLPTFRMGLAGRLGDGSQFWPWVSLEDVIAVLYQAIVDENIHGPVNVVAPQSVTNQQFTKILAKVLHRPAFFPLPVFTARAALGPFADQVLLASQRVVPARLQLQGYAFRHPKLEPALHELLGVVE